MMNNPLVRHQADIWAKKVIADKQMTIRERITAMKADNEDNGAALKSLGLAK